MAIAAPKLNPNLINRLNGLSPKLSPGLTPFQLPGLNRAIVDRLNDIPQPDVSTRPGLKRITPLVNPSLGSVLTLGRFARDKFFTPEKASVTVPNALTGALSQATGALFQGAGVGVATSNLGGAGLDRLSPGAGSDRDTSLQLAALGSFAGPGAIAGNIGGNVIKGFADAISGNMDLPDNIGKQRARFSVRTFSQIMNNLPDEQRNRLYRAPRPSDYKDRDGFVSELKWRARAVADIKNSIENAWLKVSGNEGQYMNLDFIPKESISYVDALIDRAIPDQAAFDVFIGTGGLVDSPLSPFVDVKGEKKPISSSLFSFQSSNPELFLDNPMFDTVFYNDRKFPGEVLPGFNRDDDFSYIPPTGLASTVSPRVELLHLLYF